MEVTAIYPEQSGLEMEYLMPKLTILISIDTQHESTRRKVILVDLALYWIVLVHWASQVPKRQPNSL